MTRIKFNNRMGALLCENCSTIMATKNDIPKHIMINPSPNEHYFCSEECLEEYIAKERNRCQIFKVKKD